MAEKMTIFCLSHSDDVLSRIPNQPDLVRVNLNNLEIGEFQRNDISESRAMIARSALASESKYLGYATGRWNDKFPTQCKVEDIHLLADWMDRSTVLAPALEWNPNWFEQSGFDHPGMKELLVTVADRFGLKPGRLVLYSNNFICHRDVMIDFHKAWREMFDYAFGRYGFWPPFTNRAFSYDPQRHAGYLYERLTTLYFANRTDLKLVRLGPLSDYKTVDQSS